MQTAASQTPPAMFQRFQSAVTVAVTGTQVVLTSNGLPDHTSPYWGLGNPLYEAPSAGMVLAPNRIAEMYIQIRRYFEADDIRFA
mgnify:CR=1 FL=1